MKKLFAFFSVLFTTASLYATIHYTYLGQSVNGTGRNYDVDHDGNIDFSFASGITSGFNIYCMQITSNYAAEGSSGTIPKAYDESEGMGAFHWQVGTGNIIPVTGSTSFSDTTKYVMVKFNGAGNTYYGWFLLRTGGFSLEVVSCAYSDVPDETLFAGQTASTTAVQEIVPTSFALSGINGHQVAFQNCAEYDKVMVYSLEGKVIAEINQPVVYAQYALEQADNILMVAFFRKEELLHTSKYFVQ